MEYSPAEWKIISGVMRTHLLQWQLWRLYIPNVVTKNSLLVTENNLLHHLNSYVVYYTGEQNSPLRKANWGETAAYVSMALSPFCCVYQQKKCCMLTPFWIQNGDNSLQIGVNVQIFPNLCALWGVAVWGNSCMFSLFSILQYGVSSSNWGV